MADIAYILKMYPRFSETFIINEILELERQGVDVRIYSVRKPNDGRFHSSLARVKAPVIYIPRYPQMAPERIRAAHQALRESNPEHYQKIYTRVLASGEEPAIKRFLQAGMIAEHMLRHPVKAMHAHFASTAARVAYYVKQLIGVPYSITAHAKDIFHEDVNRDSLREKIGDARFVATVSDFNRTYLQDLMGDIPSDVRRLYNGIDLTLFRPDCDVERQPNLILGVGRLVEKKGFEDLIRATSILTQQGLDPQVEIIGKGPLHESLRALIAELGLQAHVKLNGPMPQDKVLERYKQAAIFAMPAIIASDGNRDGLPTVLLEAMATGLPPISTIVTGIPEIIDHEEDGLMVAPGEPNSLAAALADLLTNPEKRKRMGHMSRRKVERLFDVRKNVGRLHQWFDMPVTIVSPLRANNNDLSEPLRGYIFPPATVEEVMKTL